MKLHAAIRIEAPPEKVWGILTDFPSYPGWNPHLKSVVGECKRGAQLTVDLKEKVHKAEIVACREKRTLRWRSGTPLFLERVHSFMLESVSGKTLFVAEEEFSGILVPFMRRRLQEGESDLEEMVQALKRQAERG